MPKSKTLFLLSKFVVVMAGQILKINPVVEKFHSSSDVININSDKACIFPTTYILKFRLSRCSNGLFLLFSRQVIHEIAPWTQAQDRPYQIENSY